MRLKRCQMIDRIVLESSSLSYNLVKSNISSFGYRERIQIERVIFLCLKLLMNEYAYDLHGLSNKHFDDLRNKAIQNEWSKDLVNIINETFEFKIYLKNMSSSNAYVRNDALLRMSPNLTHLMPMIANKFMKLITKMDNLSCYVESDKATFST